MPLVVLVVLLLRRLLIPPICNETEQKLGSFIGENTAGSLSYFFCGCGGTVAFTGYDISGGDALNEWGDMPYFQMGLP